MSDYKFAVGDIVKVVKSGRGFTPSLKGQSYIIEKLGSYEDYNGYKVRCAFSGDLHENDYANDFVGEESFKLVTKASAVLKETLLKPFNRVKLRGYGMCIVGKKYIVKEAGAISTIDFYSDDLTHSITRNYDILAVYESPECDSLNPNQHGKLLWERESKEEAAKRVKREELQKTVDKLKEELQNLEKQLEEI